MSLVRNIELGLAKGRREKDGRKMVPGSRITSMHGPKDTVIRDMHFLKINHMRWVITVKPEITHTLDGHQILWVITGYGLLQV